MILQNRKLNPPAILIENHFTYQIVTLAKFSSIYYKYVTSSDYSNILTLQNIWERGKRLEKKQILIVDDNEFFLKQQVSYLKADHLVIQTACSGQKALDSARSNKPDLILLDNFMPDILGPEVCRILKDDPATNAIPIVIVSSGEKEASKMATVLAGGDGVIFKPINRELLITMVEQFLKVPVRHWRRADVALPCSLIAEGVQSEGVIHSLSGGGAFIESVFPLVPGDMITLQFTYPESKGKMILGAAVTWTGGLKGSGPDGAGVRYLAIDPQMQLDIDNYVTTLLA
jgi:CheY-like chemotaxis protein